MQKRRCPRWHGGEGASAEESEVKTVCSEPDFDWQFRRLMQAYCMGPELSVRQLDEILTRFFSNDDPRPPDEASKNRKGGELT